MKRLLIVLAAILFASACRAEGVTLFSDSDLPAEVYGSPQPMPTATSEELPKKATVFLVRRGRLNPERRPLQPAASLQEALIVALLSGLPPGARNITSEIPEFTRLRDVQIANTVAMVDLSAAFGRSAPRETLDLRIAQLVYTLTEEPSEVISMRLLIEGIPQPLKEPDRPVNRLDYQQFAPPEGSAGSG